MSTPMDLGARIQQGSLRHRRGSVLFADDEPLVRNQLELVLRGEGFEVTAVASGEVARQELSQRRFDCLLMDLDMPGNRDLELLHFVATEVPDTPIVILTGQPTMHSAVASVRLGAVDYLTKPGPIERVLDRLDAAVHRAEVLRSVEQASAAAKEVAAQLDNLAAVIRTGPGAPAAFRHSGVLENLETDELARLSQRERQVLVELAKGQATQEIARVLGLSRNTVRNHLKSIFIKLGVNSQVALLGKVSGRPTSKRVGASNAERNRFSRDSR